MNKNRVSDSIRDELVASAISPRVVIADKQQLVRHALKMLLKENGIQVIAETGDGWLAVELVIQHKPEVLILATVNGFHPTDVLRHLKEQTHTRILMLHEKPSDEWRIMHALSAGAHGILTLNCSPAEMRKAIRSVAAGGEHFEECVRQQVVSHSLNAGRRGTSITRREHMVLELAAQGLNSAEVAQRLFISRRTAEAHRANLMRKLQLRTQTDLVLYAVRSGIISA